jgi:hypothetical protein
MEAEKIQELYSRICSGSDCILLDGETVFWGHLGHLPSCKLKQRYANGLRLAAASGIKTEAEHLDDFIQKGWWSHEKENEIRTTISFIESLKKSKSKVVLPSQREGFDKEIVESQIKLNKILTEKNSIIPVTAESYAEKYYNKYFLLYSLFKDESRLTPLFDSEEEIGDLDDSLYEELWSSVLEKIVNFDQKSIKLVAASAFFQNVLFLIGKDGSASSFFGKPIVDLTVYQIDLLSNGMYYRSFIQNSTDKIPDYILSDSAALIDWIESGSSASAGAKKMMDRTPNKNQKRGERSNRMSSIVGASKSDYEKLGIQGLANEKNNLVSAAKKQDGGKMDFYQAIKKSDS